MCVIGQWLTEVHTRERMALSNPVLFFLQKTLPFLLEHWSVPPTTMTALALWLWKLTSHSSGPWPSKPNLSPCLLFSFPVLCYCHLLILLPNGMLKHIGGKGKIKKKRQWHTTNSTCRHVSALSHCQHTPQILLPQLGHQESQPLRGKLRAPKHVSV